MNIGAYIKKLREDNNLTQEQLGDKLGVKKAAVQKWESGKVVNLKRKTIQELSEIFNVPPHSFFSEDTLPDNIIPFPKMKNVPLLGTIACGEPILAEENIENYVKIQDDIDNNYNNKFIIQKIIELVGE